MQNTYLLLLALLLVTCDNIKSFNHYGSSRIIRSSQRNIISMSSFDTSFRKQVICTVACISLLTGSMIDPSTVFGGQHHDTILMHTATADVRAQQKRTYFRFVPKLIEGIKFLKTDIRAAIDKEDWDVVKKTFEVYVSKYNPNDPTQIDSTDTYANVHYFRPLTVFAGSFAERGSSPKATALMKQEVLFQQAMSDLEGCIKDRKGEGFFAADIKMPTGKARVAQANDAYARAKDALNTYIEIANTGLMFELNKIDKM